MQDRYKITVTLGAGVREMEPVRGVEVAQRDVRGRDIVAHHQLEQRVRHAPSRRTPLRSPASAYCVPDLSICMLGRSPEDETTLTLLRPAVLSACVIEGTKVSFGDRMTVALGFFTNSALIWEGSLSMLAEVKSIVVSGQDGHNAFHLLTIDLVAFVVDGVSWRIIPIPLGEPPAATSAPAATFSLRAAVIGPLSQKARVLVFGFTASAAPSRTGIFLADRAEKAFGTEE